MSFIGVGTCRQLGAICHICVAVVVIAMAEDMSHAEEAVHVLCFELGCEAHS